MPSASGNHSKYDYQNGQGFSRFHFGGDFLCRFRFPAAGSDTCQIDAL